MILVVHSISARQTTVLGRWLNWRCTSGSLIDSRVTYFRGVNRGGPSFPDDGACRVKNSRGFEPWKGSDISVNIMYLIAAIQSRWSNNEVSVQEDSWEQWKSTVLGGVEIELVSLRRTPLYGRAAHSTKQVWKGYHSMRPRRSKRWIVPTLFCKGCIVVRRSLTAGRQVAISNFEDQLNNIYTNSFMAASSIGGF